MYSGLNWGLPLVLKSVTSSTEMFLEYTFSKAELCFKVCHLSLLKRGLCPVSCMKIAHALSHSNLTSYYFEGGAQTVSVSDNHVGSGSVSPLIVTGGKGGDVGLHDFRYIATGKAKRHRRADNIAQSSASSLARDKDQNVEGMLWYIPKAHSGEQSLLSLLVMNLFFFL